MKCMACEGTLWTTDTREMPDGSTRRKKKCHDCGIVAVTTETVLQIDAPVREQFKLPQPASPWDVVLKGKK